MLCGKPLSWTSPGKVTMHDAMIIIEKEYTTRQTSRTWLHVQHAYLTHLSWWNYQTNLEILWTSLGSISECKVRLSRSWIFCKLGMAASNISPSCENFGTSDTKVPYFLPPMDKRLQGNNGGQAKVSALGWNKKLKHVWEESFHSLG